MHYTCILGYGFDCPEPHLEWAAELTRILADKSYGFCAGGYIGIFNTVFSTAQENSAPTLLMTDSGDKEIDTSLIDIVRICSSVDHKHDSIVALADFAIVIGGGNGSEMLATKFLKAGKRVYCLQGSGGATNKVGAATHLGIKQLKEALQLL